METKKPKFIPLPNHTGFSPAKMQKRATDFYENIKRRRTVRDFSDRLVPKEIIEMSLLAAGTAPNGANKQPWHFVVVTDPEIKKKIRDAAEKEEEAFYNGRAPDEWLEALAPLGTDASKPFLERAPYLIVIFAQSHEVSENGKKIKNYYVQESVGIATGILITAIHHAGLVSLTHTPSPMGFLGKILKRPANERAYLILVVGYPEENANVPDINKKSLEEIASFL